MRAGITATIEYLASWGEGDDLRARLTTAFDRIGAHERRVAEHLYARLGEISGVTVWGPDFSDRQRAPTISVTLDGRPAGEAAARLGEQGLQLWDGHFYAVRAVESLGLAGAGGLLRTGILMYNTIEEMDRLTDAIAIIAGSRRRVAR